MRLITFNDIDFQKGSVVTIGNFDGLHLGHQSMLVQLKNLAKLKKLPTMVILFEPQPIEFLNPAMAPARLMSFRQKIEAIRQLGIDAVLCLSFNKELSKLTPRLFVETVLIKKTKALHVLVGHDFRFGHKRLGNIDLLKELGNELGFETQLCQLLEFDNEKVSSTRIRKALEQGKFQLANSLLSRSYTISGRVMHGAKRGRLIGVPTANIRIKYLPLTLRGVFCVTVKFDEITYDGIANIGFRPTVGGEKPQLEVHIFNYSGNLYSKRLEVSFKRKIRDEIKFESFEALTTQIKKDIVEAKQHLSTAHEHI